MNQSTKKWIATFAEDTSLLFGVDFTAGECGEGEGERGLSGVRHGCRSTR